MAEVRVTKRRYDDDEGKDYRPQRFLSDPVVVRRLNGSTKLLFTALLGVAISLFAWLAKSHDESFVKANEVQDKRLEALEARTEMMVRAQDADRAEARAYRAEAQARWEEIQRTLARIEKNLGRAAR